MANNHKPNDFFEALPGTVSDEDDQEKLVRDAKTTAIVTLILTIFVAIAMGVLFLKGIDTMKQGITQQSGDIVP